MKKKENKNIQLGNYNTYFFFGLLATISIVTFFIFKPFLVAMLLAAILAIFFQKLYEFFLSLTRGHKNLSSILTSLVVLLLIVIPLLIIALLVGNELVSSLQNAFGNGDFYHDKLGPFMEKMHSSALYSALNMQEFLGREAFVRYSSQLGELIMVLLQNAYLSAANTVLMILVIFFSLYYFFIDGKEIIRKIKYISPIKDAHENLLIQKFISMSEATIKGTFIVALIQGFIGGVVFYIAGIQSAVTWGVFMAVLSLLPMFGSSLIWFPASVIMLLEGNIWQGFFILATGFAFISIIDNILRPELVGKDTQMHPLLVFFATLGGLAVFGFAGFIIGPIIVALFVSMWEIFGVEFKSQLKRYNK